MRMYYNTLFASGTAPVFQLSRFLGANVDSQVHLGVSEDVTVAHDTVGALPTQGTTGYTDKVTVSGSGHPKAIWKKSGLNKRVCAGQGTSINCIGYIGVEIAMHTASGVVQTYNLFFYADDRVYFDFFSATIPNENTNGVPLGHGGYPKVELTASGRRVTVTFEF
jgi:hypothetical protein